MTEQKTNDACRASALSAVVRRTEWFSVQQDPPTVGWYEYDGWLIDEGTKLYWNGYQWGYWINEQPRRNWTQMAGVITDRWRGLYA